MHAPPAEPTPAPSRIGPPQSPRTAGGARRSGFSLPALLLFLLVAGAIAYGVYHWWFEPQPNIFPVLSDSRHHAPTPPGFGTLRWRMSLDELRAREGIPPFRTSSSAIAYRLSILNKPCLLTYGFRQDQLCTARLQFAANNDFLPALQPNQARKSYEWLKRQLEDRYGSGTETRATQPRPEIEEYERRLREARNRFSDNAERIRRRHGPGETAARHAERELAAERRYIADLEQWLEDTRAADRDDPLLARLSTRWGTGDVGIELLVDFTSSPPGLEIRYKTSPNRRSPTEADEL